MIFREKVPYLIVSILLLLCSAYLLSEKTPFTGDEFYTLDIENIHKPIPYHGVVSQIIDTLSPITPENIFSLRFSSILFTLIGIILWHVSFLKDIRETIIFSILIITSSFLIRETIFFRYYSYYFLTSTFTFILLTKWLKRCSTDQKLFYSFLGIVISPYFFFILNTLQYAFYFAYILLFEKISDSKTRLVLTAAPVIFLIYSIFNPAIIWSLIEIVNLSGHGNITLASHNIRGFTRSIIIKPFYALYQMIFGYNVAPSESIIIILLFFIISLLLVYIFYQVFRQDKKLFMEYLSIGLVPFLLIYLFFEAISLPGFTQLETKHGMLIYPLLIALIIRAYKYSSPLVTNISLSFVFVGQLIGLHCTYTKNNSDWNLIIDKVEKFLNVENSRKLIMDGRSKETFDFYNQNLEINETVSYTWEPIDSLESWIKHKETLVLLLNDYKSYTPLTLEQNWNAGSGSLDRVEKLNMILKRVNKDYYLEDSYIRYPTFLYLFKKKDDGPNNIISVGVWQHQLKDLFLPITTQSGRIIKSSLLILPGDSAYFHFSPRMVYNLEKSNKYDSDGANVGLIQFDNVQIPIIKGQNIWDVFAEFYGDNIDDATIFHSWYHTPLVSGSIRYAGSYFKHKAHIYSLYLGDTLASNIKVVNNSELSSIRIWN